MRDLYRCLDDHPLALLNAIAETWHVSLPKGEPLAMVRALGDAMLAPDALRQAVDALSAEARDALAELVSQGGAAPAQRVALRYGDIRRFGPARIAREKPWLSPSNVVEELYYRGLLFRAYGELNDYYGDLVVIPDQLLEHLPPFVVRPAEWETPLAAPPPIALSAGHDLIEDVFATLVHLRQAPLQRSLPAEGGSLIGHLVETLIQKGRFAGPRDASRNALMWSAMQRLGLLNKDEETIQPSLRARDWLRQSDESRLQSLYRAWRDDPSIDELCLMPALLCETKGSLSGPTEARRHILGFLARFPQEQWFAIDSLTMALKRHRPDFLRIDRDPGWVIRDAETGVYLDTPDTWEQVEGALTRYVLTTMLYWLGIVNLGIDSSGRGPTAFCVTLLGQRFLTREYAARPEQVRFTNTLATVDQDLEVRISMANSLHERYQLERFAEWRGQKDGVAHYQITEDSVWHSQDVGIRIEQILGFLRRITQEQLPPIAMRTLQAWGGRFGRATLERTVVLQTVDAATMAQIRADPQAAALLGLSLAPNAYQVPEERIQLLVARLKEIGIWPRIKIA